MITPAELPIIAATHAGASVLRWTAGGASVVAPDRVAREEPLEIRVNGRSVAVVMRTPGQERELAAGFLLTEGLIRHRNDLLDVLVCRDLPEGGEGNVADALLAPEVAVDFDRLSRNTFSASSCGVCGKATLDAVFTQFPPVEAFTRFPPALLPVLPERLRLAQLSFGVTGGVHASALFDRDGTLRGACEDVGRHNALDKLIGRALLDGALPLTGHALMLSGRISFELVQKAAAAGIELVIGLGAPSSLAIECARTGRVTLVGFLRPERMNIYTWPGRLGLAAVEQEAPLPS